MYKQEANMSKKVKVAFVLPANLQKEMKEQVIKDGYDLKGKSLWVSESIISLLTIRDFHDLVKINDEMQGFEKLESVLIVDDLKKQLDLAIIRIRQHYPTMEGVQSKILRTAIMQRLLLG